MQPSAYLVAFIGFNGGSSENGAAIITSNPHSVDRDAVEICKPMVMEQYRGNFAITSIVPLKRETMTRDVYGNQTNLYAILMRST